MVPPDQPRYIDDSTNAVAMLQWNAATERWEGGVGMIEWREDAEQARADALRMRRPILIDIYKDP